MVTMAKLNDLSFRDDGHIGPQVYQYLMVTTVLGVNLSVKLLSLMLIIIKHHKIFEI